MSADPSLSTDLPNAWQPPPRLAGFRIAVAIATRAVMLMITMYLLWDAYVWHKVAVERAAAVARGEPLQLSEAVFASVPPEQNAARIYRQAIDAITLTREQNYRLQRGLASEAERIAFVRSNRAPLTLCRAAAFLPNADWEMSLDQEHDSNIWIAIARLRLLFTQAIDTAALTPLGGNTDVERLRRISECLALARALRQRGILDPFILAMGYETLAAKEVECQLPNLPLDSPQARQLARELIAPLAMTDQRLWQDQAIHAVFYDRIDRLSHLTMHYHDGFPLLESFDAYEAASEWWIFQKTRDIPAAMRIDNWQTMKNLDSNDLPEPANLADFVGRYTIRGDYVPLLGNFRGWLSHFRALADTRMAATALAIRLYTLDHHCIPDRLDQLVPQYLPQVPIDPFSDHAEPLHFIPRGYFPRLYSVGRNGLDDGGSLVTDQGQLVRPDNAYFLRDQVFMLTGSYPLPTDHPTASPPNWWPREAAWPSRTN